MQAPSSNASVIMTSQSPPFTLPMRYLLLGVVGFGLFAVDLVLQSVNVGHGQFYLPGVVSLTHLLTLASLLAFVMGAVYQLATVAFLIPLLAQTVARLNFWLYAVSVAGLFFSMLYWWGIGIFVFGTLAVIAVSIYASIILLTVSRAKVGGAMKWFVMFAHIYLLVAVTFALLLVLSIQFPGFLAGFYQPLLLSHILFAVGGFFTFLIIGFTYKLLPMFTLSHGFTTTRQKWTLTLANLSLWGFAIGVWTAANGVLWLSGIVGIAAFFLHLLDLRAILRHRMRKKIEAPMFAVMVAAVVGLAGFLLIMVQLALRFGHVGWQGIVTFFLVGWVTLTLIGYAYKIIPFLIWNERYSKKSGKEKIPLIADLFHPERALPILIAFGAGMVLVGFGAILGWTVLAVIGCAAVGIAILIFCWQLLRVINLNKLQKELWNA